MLEEIVMDLIVCIFYNVLFWFTEFVVDSVVWVHLYNVLLDKPIGWHVINWLLLKIQNLRLMLPWIRLRYLILFRTIRLRSWLWFFILPNTIWLRPWLLFWSQFVLCSAIWLSTWLSTWLQFYWKLVFICAIWVLTWRIYSRPIRAFTDVFEYFLFLFIEILQLIFHILKFFFEEVDFAGIVKRIVCFSLICLQHCNLTINLGRLIVSTKCDILTLVIWNFCFMNYMLFRNILVHSSLHIKYFSFKSLILDFEFIFG